MPERRSIILAGALAFALGGAALSASVAAGGVGSSRAVELERLVLQDCGSCHGMTLKGGLGPDIRAEKLQGWARDALIAVILDGVPDTPMPPWRPLISDADAAWIADYLLKGGRP